MKTLLLTLILMTSSSIFSQQGPYLLIGTYTSGSSEGIHVYRFNEKTGESAKVSSIKTSNPSYIAIAPDQNTVYSVNENAKDGNGGQVSAFHFDKNSGKLNFLNAKSSGGDHPCYVSVDKTGKWVIAGNYSSGSLSVLKTKKNGELSDPAQTITHTGSSVNAERQNEPHVHSTVLSPDNNYLFVPDLGIDKIMIYAFNDRNGKLKPAKVPFHMVEAGNGPRHIEFTPDGRFAYLMEEMSGAVSAYSYAKGELVLLQNISALPPEFNGEVGGADIHVSPDGKFLYASNRGGSNNIAIFSINPSTGMLVNIGHQSTMGRTPRNFGIDPSGNFLLVANQGTDEVVIFRRNTESGMLTDTGFRIKESKPVCLKWIP